MKSQVSVIIKNPNGKPFKALVDNTLEAFQNLVGGYIQTVPCSGETNCIIVCNEEGKLLGLPYNFMTEWDIFVGTVVFVGVDGEEFADCPLTVQQVEKMVMNGGIIK